MKEILSAIIGGIFGVQIIAAMQAASDGRPDEAMAFAAIGVAIAFGIGA